MCIYYGGSHHKGSKVLAVLADECIWFYILHWQCFNKLLDQYFWRMKCFICLDSDKGTVNEITCFSDTCCWKILLQQKLLMALLNWDAGTHISTQRDWEVGVGVDRPVYGPSSAAFTRQKKQKPVSKKGKYSN